jgi:hypothetical protein
VELVTSAIVAASGVALLGGGLYELVVGHVGSELRPLTQSAVGAVTFLVGCGVLAGTNVLDQAFIGALQGHWQLARNVVLGVVKLLLLGTFALIADLSASALLFSWVLGMALSLVVVARPVRGSIADVIRALRPRCLRRHLGVVWRPALEHQMLNISLQVPLLLLPVLVVAVLSARTNASFYVAWMITYAAFVLPWSLATVLYAVAAHDPGALSERLRYSLSLGAALAVVAGGLVALCGGPVLSLFGPEYADTATVPLLILAIAGVPTVVKNHYVAIRRATRRVRAALPLVVAGACLEISFAVVGGHLAGLPGLCAGWVIAVIVECLLMLPTVVAALRGPREAAT